MWGLSKKISVLNFFDFNMPDKKTEEKRESSKNALKAVYYVIIGLAITESLHRTFVLDGTFIGIKCLSENNINRIILLFALLPTICRFIHGASMHLDKGAERPYKLPIDFCGFLVQSSVFYLMALSLGKPQDFLILYEIMLFVDFVWIILLRLLKYISKLQGAEIQWIISDLCMIIIFIFIIPIVESIWAMLLILVISILATGLDYFMNKDFYFPKESSTNLIDNC